MSDVLKLAKLFAMTFKGDYRVFPYVNAIHVYAPEVRIDIHKSKFAWSVNFSRKMLRSRWGTTPLRDPMPFQWNSRKIKIDDVEVEVRKSITIIDEDCYETWHLVLPLHLKPSEVFKLTMQIV